MVSKLFGFLFGSGRNVLKETAEVFMPNSEAADQRSAEVRQQAMAQFSQEFGQPGLINSLADGMNRMGRPVITYGLIFLIMSSMFDPLWFAARMQGLALVPEPLWILFTIVVSFFFGAREMSKFRGASMAKEAARIAVAAPKVVETIKELNAMAPGVAEGTDADVPHPTKTSNAAVLAWRVYMGTP